MIEYSVWEQGSLHQNKGGGELRVRNTKPACPPNFGYFFISPISEEKKKREKGQKEDHTGNIHSFRKQFYVTYK